jgi:DNA gyrase inhibitor GyrI
LEKLKVATIKNKTNSKEIGNKATRQFRRRRKEQGTEQAAIQKQAWIDVVIDDRDAAKPNEKRKRR